jgi:phosphoenolpyruvate carboxylase
MDRLAEDGARAYRGFVHENAAFIEYFQTATPLPELEQVNIGSRPARRKKTTGIETLRAIPWQFSWTQTRLILGAWLGTEEALERAKARGELEQLREMYREWPHFRSVMDLTAMVLAKTDARIAGEYDRRLVPGHLCALGADLRARLERVIRAALDVTGHRELLAENQVLQRSINVRNPYVDPINLVQVEVLRRLRGGDEDQRLRDAFVVTVNGIAAGMRNAG